jgi:tetratricopeptide (TPR) repeat protein
MAGKRLGASTGRRCLGLLVGVVACAVVAAGGWYVVTTWTSPRPPEVDKANLDPAVAALLATAHAAVHRAPRSAAAWGHLGLALSANDFHDEAQVCFARAEQLDPRDPRWPYHQGLRLALTDPAAALDKLRRAADLGDAQTVALRLQLAELLLAQNQGDEAGEQFRLVLERDPPNPRARLGLARVALLRGNLPEAQEHLEKAVASPYTQKAAAVLESEVQQRRGEPAAVEAALRRAADLPEDAPWPDPFADEVTCLKVGESANVRVATELIDRGRSAEAITLLGQTVKQYPKSARAWTLLGWAYNQQQQYQAAEPALLTALRLDPNHVAAHHYLGVALFGLGNPQAAADCFRKATALKADYTEAWFNLGQCLKEQGDRTGAIAALRTAVRCRPQSAQTHAVLGELLAKEGRREEAIACLRNAAQLAPEDETVKQRLETLLQQAGEPKKP